MQRCNAAKPLHLADRKVAHSNGADLPLLQECMHCLRSFFDRDQWVGPMNLIDVNVIGSKPAQGIINLPQDAGAARIARYSSAVPLKSGLGGNKHVRAQAAFGNRLAYDLLGTAESIGRSRVDEVDAVLECGPDGSDRLG